MQKKSTKKNIMFNKFFTFLKDIKSLERENLKFRIEVAKHHEMKIIKIS